MTVRAGPVLFRKARLPLSLRFAETIGNSVRPGQVRLAEAWGRQTCEKLQEYSPTGAGDIALSQIMDFGELFVALPVAGRSGESTKTLFFEIFSDVDLSTTLGRAIVKGVVTGGEDRRENKSGIAWGSPFHFLFFSSSGQTQFMTSHWVRALANTLGGLRRVQGSSPLEDFEWYRYDPGNVRNMRGQSKHGQIVEE